MLLDGELCFCNMGVRGGFIDRLLRNRLSYATLSSNYKNYFMSTRLLHSGGLVCGV